MSTKVSGTFTATGASAESYILHGFNVSVKDNTASTIVLERSYDDGATWEIRNTWTNVDASVPLNEPERKVKYRLRCSAYTSGTVTYRIGGSGGAS